MGRELEQYSLLIYYPVRPPSPPLASPIAARWAGRKEEEELEEGEGGQKRRF